jgi:hypothetical protein
MLTKKGDTNPNGVKGFLFISACYAKKVIKEWVYKPETVEETMGMSKPMEEGSELPEDNGRNKAQSLWSEAKCRSEGGSEVVTPRRRVSISEGERKKGCSPASDPLLMHRHGRRRY